MVPGVALAAVSVATVVFAALRVVGPAAGASTRGRAASVVGPGPWYAVALGASLAAGSGASTLSHDYVSDVAVAESTRFPGLSVDNVSCGGDTVYAVLHGDHCRPAGRTQLGDAVSFLESHPGHVAYITIDIGADEILPCITHGNVKISCVEAGLAEDQQNLPIVLHALQAAAPGVPLVGSVYYDPELYTWILGPAGQAIARSDAAMLTQLNSTLERIYASAGVPVADWQGAFAARDFAQQATWNGQQVPLNVYRTCAWTHECDSGHVGQNVHTNDIGYAVLAKSMEGVLSRFWDRSGTGTGVWLVGADGGVYAMAGAPFLGSMGAKPLNAPVVGMAATPTGDGYWLVASDGGVFAFGAAQFFGSMGAKPLNAPVVGMAATPTGDGYWLVASDGGVFAFGAAQFFGSMGAEPLNAPVVGGVSSPSGFGYWLVASDGGVFAFGDAGFFGSMGAVPLNRPIVNMAVSADGNGYWLVASDGGVFAFGDAGFFGSTGAMALAKPVAGIVPSLSGGGYELVASDGGAFAFGDSPFSGSLAGTHVNAPIVGAVSS
ncbi:MAG: GDSL-type esterase/lipase family protein [Acidimicrobiales bacterium]